MLEPEADDASPPELLSGNDFADLLPELQSTRPDDPPDPTGSQPVDDPQNDDADPHPYGIADL